MDREYSKLTLAVHYSMDNNTSSEYRMSEKSGEMYIFNDSPRILYRLHARNSSLMKNNFDVLYIDNFFFTFCCNVFGAE